LRLAGRCAEHGRRVDHDERADVGDAERAAQELAAGELLVERVVAVTECFARAIRSRGVAPSIGRGVEDALDQVPDRREPDLVRGRLELAAARARDRVARVERRIGIAILQVFEHDRRVVDHHVAVDEHGHLTLRVERDHVGVVRLVASGKAPADLDPFVGERLLGERDPHLGGEQAERSRVELHRILRRVDGHSLVREAAPEKGQDRVDSGGQLPMAQEARRRMWLALAGDGPLYRQAYRGLRAAILDRRLGPGERLPSSRVLARDAKLARNTVLQAYEQLVAEGYAESRRGAGTFVVAELPEATRARRPV